MEETENNRLGLVQRRTLIALNGAILKRKGWAKLYHEQSETFHLCVTPAVACDSNDELAAAFSVLKVMAESVWPG
jgi:hypothetical protein